MSYDLSFYKSLDNNITRTEIENYLDQQPNFNRESEEQWFYQNEDTGVYCSFEFNSPEDSEDLDEELTEEFNGFENTGFTFSINFVRPQFFGKECFPLVEQLCETLDLYVVNYQNEGIPKKYPKGALEKEWGDSNLSIAERNFTELRLAYLEMEKSDYSWQFSFKRSELQERLGDNFFVPKVIYLRKNNSAEISTMCVWPHAIPVVLPKVDYVMIMDEYRKFLWKKKVEGLVRYEDVISQLGEYFSDEDGNKIFHSSESQFILDQFRQLPIVSKMEDFGGVVSVDSFVNAK